MYVLGPISTQRLLYPLAGIPCVTDCVMAELEKLGHKYRVALRCVPFDYQQHLAFLRR